MRNCRARRRDGGRRIRTTAGQSNNAGTGLLDGWCQNCEKPGTAVNTTEDSINLGPVHGLTPAIRWCIALAVEQSADWLMANHYDCDGPSRVCAAWLRKRCVDGKVLGLDAAPATGNQHVLVSRTGDIAGAADGEIEPSAPSGRRPRRRQY
jgi:hypothetical protein